MSPESCFSFVDSLLERKSALLDLLPQDTFIFFPKVFSVTGIQCRIFTMDQVNYSHNASCFLTVQLWGCTQTMEPLGFNSEKNPNKAHCLPTSLKPRGLWLSMVST